ncbi:MAG: hypothetical protein ACK587_05995 [Cyanobacteriota bacterium]
MRPLRCLSPSTIPEEFQTSKQTTQRQDRDRNTLWSGSSAKYEALTGIKIPILQTDGRDDRIDLHGTSLVVAKEIISPQAVAATIVSGMVWNFTQAMVQLQTGNFWQTMHRISTSQVVTAQLPLLLVGGGLAFVAVPLSALFVQEATMRSIGSVTSFRTHHQGMAGLLPRVCCQRRHGERLRLCEPARSAAQVRGQPRPAAGTGNQRAHCPPSAAARSAILKRHPQRQSQ